MEIGMKVIKVILLSIMIGFLGWFAICYLDVVIHNLTPGYEYPWWNMFAIMLNL